MVLHVRFVLMYISNAYRNLPIPWPAQHIYPILDYPTNERFVFSRQFHQIEFDVKKMQISAAVIHTSSAFAATLLVE